MRIRHLVLAVLFVGTALCVSISVLGLGRDTTPVVGRWSAPAIAAIRRHPDYIPMSVVVDGTTGPGGLQSGHVLRGLFTLPNGGAVMMHTHISTGAKKNTDRNVFYDVYLVQLGVDVNHVPTVTLSALPNTWTVTWAHRSSKIPAFHQDQGDETTLSLTNTRPTQDYDWVAISAHEHKPDDGTGLGGMEFATVDNTGQGLGFGVRFIRGRKTKALGAVSTPGVKIAKNQ